MKNKPEYILAHEWIGLEVEVVESPNKYEIGLKGEVVDETQNTLKIKTKKGLKTIAKRKRVFKVKFKNWILKVKGDLITFRPEERVKKGLLLIKRAKGWW
ncbi:ribonuclease P protein subunit [Candidatus Bathyarchaeota archaeon]|nr:MAG: ribonuclease P protein subunit [Candidatus Bathyarchaeota archaeon]